MLRIAQIESGTRRAGFADFSLSELLESLVETYGPVAEDSRHVFTSQITPGVRVTGDKELLTQLFANLIENAIKHTPEGSHVEASLELYGVHAIAVVADNGPGIPEPMQEHALRRFVRLEASRTTPGSGLGLSLVAAIADLHGIHLELRDNRPGLRVVLPLQFASRPAMS